MRRIIFTMLLFYIVLLLSCHKGGKKNIKAKWIEDAFIDITTGDYPKIKAMAWWHENFDGSALRIDSSPESLEAYRNGVGHSLFLTTPLFSNNKLVESPVGIYHAAYPDFGGTEDMVSIQKINDFETLAKKDITWAYFSNNWLDDIVFPINEINVINTAGKVPFIRLMARSVFEEGGPDAVYTMQAIIDGDFDVQLNQWAIDAKNIEIPLLAEFGTEVNGDWFPWNGQYNGGGTTTEYGDMNLADGGERFRDAYRHIIDICNANEAFNITWFFHVGAYSYPETDWNSIAVYYPGDDYIDWLGVSIYGPQTKSETYQSFSDILKDVYPTLTHLSAKPIAVLEFAITE